MLFKKKITEKFMITIPEPCSEDWNKMSVVGDVHRHCDSCAKNVIDFSQMNDDEVLSFFRNRNEKICGRFRMEQLDRPFAAMPQKSRPASWWKAAALLPLTLFGRSATAQTDSVVTPDSAQVVNDTLTDVQSLSVDSALAEIDSLATNADSLAIAETDSIKPETPKVHIIEQICVSSGSVVYVFGDTFTPKESEHPPMIMGNITEPLPPRLAFVDFFQRYWWPKERKSDDRIASTLPDVTNTDQLPASDPIPPTIPESPWYEAILPPSLRPRRNG